MLQSYDYTLEKVKMYTRVPLGDLTKISKGKNKHCATTALYDQADDASR